MQTNTGLLAEPVAVSCKPVQVCWLNQWLGKDTVATDEEDNKVEADNDANLADTAICSDSIVHHHVPVLTCQDLINTQIIHFIQTGWNVNTLSLLFLHLNIKLLTM